jgi:WD40 repeat protein
VWAVTFSPDGRTLATAGADGAVRLWDVTAPVHPVALGEPLKGHIDRVKSVAFSPDGHTLASASLDHSVRLWDLKELAHPVPLGGSFIGHPSYVESVMFSPDLNERILATSGSGSDATVRLWDLKDLAHPVLLGDPLTGHTNTVVSVAFSPDGHILASVGADRTVLLWERNVEQAIRRICDYTKNTLTRRNGRNTCRKTRPTAHPARDLAGFAGPSTLVAAVIGIHLH